MKLSEIPLTKANRLHSVALFRLTLRVMGEVHGILWPLQEWLTGQVRASADAQGNVEPERLMGLNSQLSERWRPAMRRYTALLQAAREQAASLPFGVLVVQHNAMMAAARRPLQEQMSPAEIGTIIRLWQRRRELALLATQNRVYGDGLTLSQRIWRMETDGLGRIRAQLAAGMSDRTNAWELATRLEAELGAGQDIPRWTRTRLYGMTPRDRMTSDVGLLRGPEGRGQGVAYNALRLARNELQHANHAVTTEIARHNPAVTGRKTVLSPGHPRIDICDEWAAGGPYDKTLEILPLHPQCMCYYRDVLMDKSEFARQVRGWLDGQNEFLNDYSNWLGVRQVTEPMSWAMPISEALEMWLSMSDDTHAMALRLS